MKDKKKLLCGLVSLFVILGLAIPLSSTLVRAQPAIEIWDWYDLDAIRSNLSGSYILMNDLDSTTAGYAELAGPTANGGKGWQPIGTFSGSFNGQGYEIRDLFINRREDWYVGLFGSVEAGAVIHDVRVVNADVTGLNWVGGLVGWNRGTVSSSHFTGKVAVEDWGGGGLVGSNEVGGVLSNCCSVGSVAGYAWIGGLVGYNSYGTVDNSCSIAAVTGNHTAGGLVGANVYGTIRNSFSSGGVSSTGDLGGLVGRIYEGTVSDCYATGSVTRSSGASEYVGGFTGRNWRGKIINCYSTGRVHYEGAADPTNKGFAGHVFTDGGYEMTGDFWDVETSGQIATAGHATGKTTAEMQDISTYADAGWDIGTTTLGDPTGGYPFLSWQLGNSPTWLMYGGTLIAVGWETYPINKVRVLLPWIALFAAFIAGISLLVLRCRRS